MEFTHSAFTIQIQSMLVIRAEGESIFKGTEQNLAVLTLQKLIFSFHT